MKETSEQTSARDIINGYTKGRMIARPEFYSGRGPVSSDLNSDLLEMIYGGIKTEIGTRAAAAFVKMVDALEDLSATAFLNALYRLEGNGWIFKRPTTKGKNDGIAVVGVNEPGCMVANMGTIMSMMGRRNSPAEDKAISANIKASFLMKHGIRPKSENLYPSRFDW